MFLEKIEAGNYRYGGYEIRQPNPNGWWYIFKDGKALHFTGTLNAAKHWCRTTETTGELNG